MKPLQEIDSAQTAVLFGLCVGLGIAVHAAFLLLAAAIGIAALTVKAAHTFYEHAEQTRLAYRTR